MVRYLCRCMLQTHNIQSVYGYYLIRLYCLPYPMATCCCLPDLACHNILFLLPCRRKRCHLHVVISLYIIVLPSLFLCQSNQSGNDRFIYFNIVILEYFVDFFSRFKELAPIFYGAGQCFLICFLNSILDFVNIFACHMLCPYLWDLYRYLVHLVY